MAPADNEWHVRANMTTGWIARGGALTVSQGKLEFRNSTADRLLTGRSQFSIALSDIAQVTTQSGSFRLRNLFNGGLRTRLRVITSTSGERLFVIRSPLEVAASLTRIVSLEDK